MTTLQELAYYCNEPEPVGALMLTGEWGCGKTYLLENSLKKELETKHIILRISLFGLSSVEAIDVSVRNAWMNAYLEDKGWNDKSETLTKLQGKLSRLPLPDNLKNIVSFNPATLLNVENNLNGKNVVLVFDDLERSKLDTIDVLGCINDYCENLKFHTIVVANEDKIQDKRKENLAEKESKENTDGESQQVKIMLGCSCRQTAAEISYEEIKEKIIERTIKYKPDYVSIVHAVIADQICLSEQYHGFLAEYEQDILRLFALASNEFSYEVEDIFSEPKEPINRPYNIRSLKCALQDFYRVYRVLTEQDLSDLDKWLYSFISYMLAYKAGIAKEGKYGTLFTDEEVRVLYPAFNNRFIFKTVKNWILKGEWDERLLNKEIAIIKERDAAVDPKDVVRTNRFLDIEEDTVKQGFPEVLKMAYAGQLSLDEYVNFIMNSYWSRVYQLDVAFRIDWEKVKHGIQICTELLVAKNAEDSRVGNFIEDKNKEVFLPDEWEAYELIEKFRNGNVLIFNTNRKLYLKCVQADSTYAFLNCERKRMDVFDDEMATVTAEAFSQCTNGAKIGFCNDFKNMWQHYDAWPDIRIAETVQGLKKLLKLLEMKKESFRQQDKMIAVGHTNRFIKIVEQLLPESSSEG